MDNKSEMFDLKREKQELDQFLSTIAGDETQEAVMAKPVHAPQAETLTEPFAEFDEEAPKPRPLASVDRSYDMIHPSPAKDKPPVAVPEAIKSEAEEVVPLKPEIDAELKPKVTSSFLPGDEAKKEKKEPPAPKEESVAPARPAEASDVMTRFGETPAFEKKEAREPEKKAGPAAPYDFSPEKKKIGKGKLFGILLMVVIALLIALFWLMGDAIKTFIPGTASVMGTGKTMVAPSESDVNLANIRQRLVYSAKLGKSVRVIEGIAENISAQTLSHIKISATLYDDAGAKLATMDTLGGNILIDDRLESLDAAAIQSALQTGKGAEAKIPPTGQVPFMIVFTNEPAGVFKMSVITVGLMKY